MILRRLSTCTRGGRLTSEHANELVAINLPIFVYINDLRKLLKLLICKFGYLLLLQSLLQLLHVQFPLNGRAVVPWLQKTNGAAVGVSGVVEAASGRGT